MKRIISTMIVGLAMMLPLVSFAEGLSYAVSLERAKELLKADESKHLLIFYTEGW
jgi:hypothetical protein